MKNKLSKPTKIIISVVVCLLIGVGSFFLGYGVRSAKYSDEIDTIDYILSMYKKYYYEELSSDEIVDAFANSILDAYSDYYTKEEFALIMKAAEGGHEGCGVAFNSNTNEISKVVWNSPCDRAGVTEGGKITGIGLTTDEIEEIVSPSEGGESGVLTNKISDMPVNQQFVFEIDYGGEKKYFTVCREEYTETYVRYYTADKEYGFLSSGNSISFCEIGDNVRFDLEGLGDVAVIDYNSFDGIGSGLSNSAEQFAKALSLFKEQGKTKLILDLRSNGGGYMDILTQISSHLVDVDDGSVVPVSVVRYKDGKEEVYKSSKTDYRSYNFQSIVILANSGTASASEALIGAVLDYDSSNIVKVVLEGYSYKVANYQEEKFDLVTVYRSYGKGIMQTTFQNLFSGTAIRLTTAKIYWPKSNVSIHQVGITTALNDTLYASSPKIFNESENGAVYDAVSFSK